MSNTITHCLSIREPYVSQIMGKIKTLEYRSRKLIARPPETIAIATSKTGAGEYLPGGHIVGVARISAVVPWDDYNNAFWERAAMNRIDEGLLRGGYAMLISGFAACEPIPIRGNCGIYRTPEGFTPKYTQSSEELAQWWQAARVWHEGPKDDDERAYMERMLTFGLGWRIDD